MRYYNPTSAAISLTLVHRILKIERVFRFPKGWSENIPLEFESSSQIMEARKNKQLIREKAKPLSQEERLEKATAPEVKPILPLRADAAVTPVVVSPAPDVLSAAEEQDAELFTNTETE